MSAAPGLRRFSAHRLLHRLTVRADELRAEVYDINCRSEDVSGWWHGLSDKIIILRGELNALRKKLAVCSTCSLSFKYTLLTSPCVEKMLDW